MADHKSSSLQSWPYYGRSESSLPKSRSSQLHQESSNQGNSNGRIVQNPKLLQLGQSSVAGNRPDSREFADHIPTVSIFHTLDWVHSGYKMWQYQEIKTLKTLFTKFSKPLNLTMDVSYNSHRVQPEFPKQPF
uniref:Uncharacterized protein n=1 Tax=Cacopsylla melanoneura TaxID=428564 RepID=A0A8D8TSF8_9HEMI